MKPKKTKTKNIKNKQYPTSVSDTNRSGINTRAWYDYLAPYRSLPRYVEVPAPCPKNQAQLRIHNYNIAIPS